MYFAVVTGVYCGTELGEGEAERCDHTTRVQTQENAAHP